MFRQFCMIVRVGLFITIMATMQDTGAEVLERSYLAEEINSKQVDAKIGSTREFVLDNGLRVFIRPLPDRGLVCLMALVKAGSTTEGRYTGSGVSHFVEHMLFKGTTTRGVGVIPAQIKSYGGIMDGWTSFDYTGYQIVVLKEYLKQAAEVLADALQNPVFDQKELEKERKVILREISLNEDDPNRKVSQCLFSQAYISHLYRHPVIGYKELFKKLTRQDLVNYHHQMYSPDNTVLALTGDFEPDIALTYIKEIFGSWPRVYQPPLVRPQEPAQLSARKLTLRSDVEICYLEIGFHGPALYDKDLFAMDTLAHILGGDKQSRLYKLLVEEKQLVSSVSCWSWTPKDKGLFGISVRLMHERDIEQVVKLILKEINKIKKQGVTKQEIKIARRQILSDYIQGLETAASQARDICTSYVLTGDPDFSSQYLRGINRVSARQIRAAAEKYLKPNNLTRVAIVPRTSAVTRKPSHTENHKEENARTKQVGTAEVRTDLTTTQTKRDQIDTCGRSLRTKIERIILPSGITLLLKTDHCLPRCSVNAVFIGGLMAEEPENNGISNLTIRMLSRGTKKRKRSQILKEISELAGSVNFYSGNNSLGIQMNILSADLDRGLELLFDLLFNPTFPEKEIQKEKELIISQIKRENDDIFSVCHRALKQIMFERHPFKLPVLGTEQTVGSITRQQLVDFHHRFFVPENFTLSIFGDFEKESILKQIKKYFSTIKNTHSRKQLEPQPIDSRTKIKTLNPILKNILKSHQKMPESGSQRKCMVTKTMEREQAIIMFGFPLYDIYHRDRFSFSLVHAAISGHSSRLFINIRERLGLAYMVGGFEVLGLDRGYYVIYAAVAPAMVNKAKEEILKQIKILKKEGIKEEEITSARNEFLGKRCMQQESIFSQAFDAALNEIYGLGYDFGKRFEAQIMQVNQEQIREILEKYLDTHNYCLAVVGPNLVREYSGHF